MRVSNFSAFDLNSFHTLHDRFSPTSAVSVPEIECYAQCHRRSRAVAGDYFFLIPTPARNLVIAAGHISIPGAAGFIAVTGLAAGIRTLATRGAEPRDIVAEAGRIFWEVTPEHAVAPLFCARIEAARHRILFTQAGNQTCLILRGRDQRLQLLDSNAAMLGLCLGHACAQRELLFESGDTLLAMTEGLAEVVTSQLLRDALLLRTREIPSHLIAATQSRGSADRAAITARLKQLEAERPRPELAERVALAGAA